MTIFQVLIAWFWITALVMMSGCGSPTPTTKNTGPPAPPAVPAPEPEPTLPPKPQPDPYETAMSEVSTIVKRYGAVYASVRDDATAEKAIEEIGRMTARLRALTEMLGKTPYKSGQEKYLLPLQTELINLQTAQLSNPDMQRVLGDPELGLKFIAAHQSFVTEGLLPLGQAVTGRQPSASEEPAPSATPQRTPATK